jgi:hypothetical protein
MATEELLIADAVTRGWDHEAERHRATQHRLQQLLSDLGEAVCPPGETSPATVLAHPAHRQD